MGWEAWRLGGGFSFGMSAARCKTKWHHKMARNCPAGFSALSRNCRGELEGSALSALVRVGGLCQPRGCAVLGCCLLRTSFWFPLKAGQVALSWPSTGLLKPLRHSLHLFVSGPVKNPTDIRLEVYLFSRERLAHLSAGLSTWRFPLCGQVKGMSDVRSSCRSGRGRLRHEASAAQRARE